MIERIRQLRARTNAPLRQCKKALEENNGHVEDAIVWLRAQGIDTRPGRSTEQGIAYAYQHPGGQVAVLVEINCETDFTARSGVFQNLCKELAMQIAATPPSTEDAGLHYWEKTDALLYQQYNRDPSRKVSDLVKDAERATGENIVVRRFVRYEVGGFIGDFNAPPIAFAGE
jgi:elongation factor Ts